MTLILILFIAIALTFYVLFGGADFGAGILELFTRGKTETAARNIITKAIGPVWEANHVWLILIVVILFMGFPPIFVVGSTYLHIPAAAALLGIVIRGCAFTYRHYDVKSEEGYKIYTLLFSTSSLWTALWLGILASSLQRGKITEHPATFWDAYIAPWIGIYPLAVGIFTATIFAYLAAIYLTGETSDPDSKQYFKRKVVYARVAMLFAGAIVFIASQIEGLELLPKILGHPVSITALLFSTLALIPHSGWGGKYSRIIAGFQVLMVLTGWYALHAENVILFADGSHLTFAEAAAPRAVQRQLVFALIVGTLLIFPNLYILLRIFKGPRFWLSR